ncbi:MAG: leucyl/phenylalanyl-tRNA--protein transferase [Acidimicrobiales bacterium]
MLRSPDASSALASAPQPVRPSSWLLPDPGDDQSGLVGFGADLAPETLVDAYRRGIFPWPHEGVEVPWFSPDPRALIVSGQVHVSRTLARTLRRSGWETTVDAAFAAVVDGCRVRPGDGTWITDEMEAAYVRLHRLGWAHSVEVWAGDELVGGIYGVRVGGCFTGESMFHRRTDGSKAALVDLASRWQAAGGAFVDAQLTTEHLTRMGAVEVPRPRFLAWLAEVRDLPVAMRLDRLPVSRLADPGSDAA